MKHVVQRTLVPSLAALMLACGSTTALGQAVGTSISYQGSLNQSGVPATGTYDMEFRLFGAASGGVPLGSVCLEDVAVVEGRFTVDLDFGAAYTGEHRFLEILVRAGDGVPCSIATGFDLLTPRQEIKGAPYAQFALDASNATNLGGQPASNIATLSGANLFTGQVTLNNPTNILAGSGAGLTNLPWGSLTGVPGGFADGVDNDSGGLWAANGANVYYNAGNVGIGTASPTHLLHVSGSAKIGDSSSVDQSLTLRPANGIWLLGSNNSGTGSNGNQFYIYDSATGGNAYYLTVQRQTGNVGIGTQAPTHKLHVNGSAKIGDSSSVDQSLTFRSANGIWQLGSNNQGNGSSGNHFYIYDSATGGNAYYLTVQRQTGNVGIGTSNPGSKLSFGTYTGGTASPTITLWESGSDRSGIGMENGAMNFWAGGAIKAKVRNDGVFEVKTLLISGGSDLVEGFDSMAAEIEPGTLMVIDPEHPGQLMPSTSAYDSKVAGIVSGAGGVSPGLKMGQDGVMDGKNPIAMTGRVYVKCTTANGSIKPGDLLTTSNVAGHAMKAADFTRSQGAVIGKAMSALDEESGLVLVLVNLQ